jgi:hypothetical protein
MAIPKGKKWTTTQCLSAECDHPEHQRGEDVTIEEDNVTINAKNNKGTVIGRSNGETWRF